MTEEVARYHIYTSSAVTNNGSQYSFYIKKPILLTHPSHYFKVILKQVTIPYSWQAVNPAYNKLNYILTRGATTYPQQQIAIPSGNYSIYDLLTQVQTGLASSIQTLSGFIPTFTWSYSSDNSKVTFNVTNNDSVLTTITLLADTNQVGIMLGISSNISFGYTVGNVNTTATSTQPVNCCPVNQIFIRSNTLKQQQNVENLIAGQYNDYSNILGVAPVYTQPKSLIQFYDLNIENHLVNDVINEIQLFLTDNRSPNTPLDLQGLNWSCCMTIIEIRHLDLLQSDTYMSSVKINHQLRGANGPSINPSELRVEPSGRSLLPLHPVTYENTESKKVLHPESIAFPPDQ